MLKKTAQTAVAILLTAALLKIFGVTVLAGSTTTYTTISYSGDTWYN
jgi:hypothetical protein